MRETSGLGDPPSNITARIFLPVRSTIVSAGSRGTGLMGLWSSLAAFLSLTNGYAAICIHSSVSSGSDSGIRSKMYFVGLTTRGCTYSCMVISSSSGRSGTIVLSTKLAAQLSSFQTRARIMDTSTMVWSL